MLRLRAFFWSCKERERTRKLLIFPGIYDLLHEVSDFLSILLLVFVGKKKILLRKYVVCLHVSLFSSGWSCFSCLPVALNFSCPAVFSAAFPDFLLPGFDSRGWCDCGPVMVNSRPVGSAV
jgi:hypothetical protein